MKISPRKVTFPIPVVISHSEMLLVSVIILATPKLPRGGEKRGNYVSVSNRDMFSQINWHSCSEGQEAG